MSADEDAPAALYEVREQIAIITFNRPHALNAVNSALSTAVGEALEAAAADPGVRVVVVTGAGRAFSAGADLKELAAERPLTAVGHPEWGFAGPVRHWIDKPIIAAVNGFAMGGGTEIASACDLAIASDTAVFGLPEVKRGLFAAAGGVVRMQRQVQMKRALEEGIDALTAERWGLINRVVPADALLDEVATLAGKIAANAPLAVQHSKLMVHRTWAGGSDWEKAWSGGDPWEANDEAMHVVFGSDDALEGPRAFAEKRAPRWTGT